MRTQSTIILSLILGAILWTSVGCALMAVAPKNGTEHYPYHGPLVETNGIPINPPRW